MRFMGNGITSCYPDEVDNFISITVLTEESDNHDGRTQVRRARPEPRVPGRTPHESRHARQRHHRRERHPHGANNPQPAARPERTEGRRHDGERRSLHADSGIQHAERATPRGRRRPVRESEKRGRRRIRQLDPSRAARRDLRFWAYALEHADTGIRESQWDNLDHMGEMGLPVHKSRIRSQTPAEVFEYYRQMVEVRSGLPFEADGIVIKIDAHRYQQQLGSTGHDPRWAIAWKFPCAEARTRLNRIFISMGRFGKLTPVAELEPVSLDGATIRHASLHNESDIRRKDIRAGDIVVIKRAGGVIPQVTGPADTDPGRSTTRFSMPQHCPEYREPVRQSPDDAAHWCDNDNCGSKPVEALKHFVSKDSFDIDGLGPVICKAMITSGLVTNPGEVFHLTAEQIRSLDRMGPKLAERIHDSIQGAKSRPLHRVLYALGIYRLGHHVSAQLARRCNSLEEARRLSRDDLMRLNGINEKIADSVLAGFAKRRTIETIRGMRDAGVVLERTERAEPTAPNSTPLFEGTRICVTGTLKHMTRDEAQEHIRTLRGTAVSTVTKRTDVLVVGAKPGSKVAKARQTNTIILGRRAVPRETCRSRTVGVDEDDRQSLRPHRVEGIIETSAASLMIPKKIETAHNPQRPNANFGRGTCPTGTAARKDR